MKFNFPNKETNNYVYNQIRKLYKNNFYDFVKELGQKTFFITSSSIDAAVVVDVDERRLDIFMSERGFYTCHNLFAGDEQALANVGFSEYSLCEFEKEEINNSYYKQYINRYRFYHKDKKTIAYLSALAGQMPFVCDDAESFKIGEILKYLNHIQSFFTSGEEKLDVKEDVVMIFEFNDEEMTYDSAYELLENYDFLPNFDKLPRKQKRFAEKLSSLVINSGKLYLDSIYCSTAHDHFDYSNNVSLALLPIILYAANEEDTLDYEIYCTRESDERNALKESLLTLFNRTGLYDTIVTSNVYIYTLLVKNLSPLGIDVILEVNEFNTIISGLIKNTVDLESNFDHIIEFLEQLKTKYLEVIDRFIEFEEMMRSGDSVFEEVQEDDLEEFDDLDFETNPNNVC